MSDEEYAYTDEEGEYLVKLARESLETRLNTGSQMVTPEDCPYPKLLEESGVFVTLRKFGQSDSMSLRGCIGMIEARDSLLMGVIKMAIAAGLEDPRFPEVQESELDHLVFEITAMTVPKLLTTKDPEAIKNSIKIGRDGVIMEQGHQRGLFLPQVPVEQNWDIETYLPEACRKAWLPRDAWKEKSTKIYTFQGEIFEEEKPRGHIVRKIITQ
ncbi:MAG TPA: TIGR00296 family protein [Candidatus Lokiarchaeia archaeon]|nr:TIGR00296 family protein [Candidatus Lokiarchaeia archaeon]